MVGLGITMKATAAFVVLVPTVTEIGPVVALAGSETVRLEVLAVMTVACTPLKRTIFWPTIALKP